MKPPAPALALVLLACASALHADTLRTCNLAAIAADNACVAAADAADAAALQAAQDKYNQCIDPFPVPTGTYNYYANCYLSSTCAASDDACFKAAIAACATQWLGSSGDCQTQKRSREDGAGAAMADTKQACGATQSSAINTCQTNNPAGYCSSSTDCYVGYDPGPNCVNHQCVSGGEDGCGSESSCQSDSDCNGGTCNSDGCCDSGSGGTGGTGGSGGCGGTGGSGGGEGCSVLGSCSVDSDCAGGDGQFCNGGCCAEGSSGGGGGGGTGNGGDGYCGGCSQQVLDDGDPQCVDSCGNTIDECTCNGYEDPIVIDLSGQGYLMTNAANGVKFDMLDTGNPIQMAWTGKNSNVGFLVIDLNGNGKIDNGGELFSNVSPQSGDVLQRNGFRALAMYDQPKEGGNRDGIIDSRDAVFSKLRIWVDTNQNGKSEPNELMTMAQAGIKSIGLKYAPDNWKDVNGNEFRFTAKATFTNGRTEAIYDVYLKTPDTTPQAKK